MMLCVYIIHTFSPTAPDVTPYSFLYNPFYVPDSMKLMHKNSNSLYV